ncbi:MAG TPA: diguanylate cyclase [Candidatus Mcinerneyibacteriales bacterium]|nr:diguanylate cyclase [Candidatus Mcinerneyibacteriales bacterium]
MSETENRDEEKRPNTPQNYLKMARLEREGSPQKVIEYCNLGLTLPCDNEGVIAELYETAGDAFFDIENFNSALNHWQKAYDIFRETGSLPRAATVLIKIGKLYEATMDFSNAETNFTQAGGLFEQAGDSNGVALCSYHVGSMYFNNGDLHKALEFLLKADELKKESENRLYQILIGDVNNKLGEIHSKLFNFEDALKYFFEAMQVYNYLDYPMGIITVMNNIGEVFMKEGLHEEAETFLKDGYEHAKQSASRMTELKYLVNLSELHSQKGQFEEAYSRLIQAYHLRDMIFSQTLSKKITDIEARHEIDKKEKELEIYRLKNIDLQKANDIIKSQNEELQAAYLRMEQLAQTDPLTGLSNRRNIMEKIKLETYRAQRSGEPFSFLLIDIDHFKSINDTYGHDCGDRVLVSLAAILTKHMRKIDVISRWGGEEFLALLPRTDKEGAANLAEKIRSVVEKAPVASCGEKIFVTVTIGVSVFDRSPSADQSIKEADEALYQGKKYGRNKVVVYKPSS